MNVIDFVTNIQGTLFFSEGVTGSISFIGRHMFWRPTEGTFFFEFFFSGVVGPIPYIGRHMFWNWLGLSKGLEIKPTLTWYSSGSSTYFLLLSKFPQKVMESYLVMEMYKGLF